MKYVTITASSYEEALKKAEQEYGGNNIRIHSRRDYTVGGGLFSRKKNKCDLTIYLLDGIADKSTKSDEASILEFEKEARTPNPESLSKKEMLNSDVYRGTLEKLDKAEEILLSNDISDPLKSYLLKDFSLEKKVEMEIAERLIDSLYLKNEIDNKYLVLLGPTGSGKTTTCAKLAINYKKAGYDPFIISIDSYRVGSFYQIEKLTSSLNIKVRTVNDESAFRIALKEAEDHGIVLIDTMGLSRNDDELNLKLKSMLNYVNRANSEFIFVASSTTKIDDLNSIYDMYCSYLKIDSLISSKVDECSTIGTVLSFSFKHKCPMTYLTNGQRVPEDIIKADGINVLYYFNGLDLDLKRYKSQIEG